MNLSEQLLNKISSAAIKSLFITKSFPPAIKQQLLRELINAKIGHLSRFTFYKSTKAANFYYTRIYNHNQCLVVINFNSFLHTISLFNLLSVFKRIKKSNKCEFICIAFILFRTNFWVQLLSTNFSYQLFPTLLSLYHLLNNLFLIFLSNFMNRSNQ